VVLVITYVVSVAALWLYARRHPQVVTAKDAVRLLPDVLRLVQRLAADQTLPRRVRVRVVLLLIYLASPIDLVPDFLPIIGFADDVVVVALVLRSVVRAAGPAALTQHWRGTPEGLALVHRLVGLRGG
jgi:uncharacterized membrane protein YkvA (DUF1232 family)